MALFYSGLFFDSFLSVPMTLYSSYSNDTKGQAIMEYFVSFTDLVDSVSPFIVSNFSTISATSHRTNTNTSTQTSFLSGNPETPLGSPKTFLEKNIFSSLASRNSTPSSNPSSLNISLSNLPEYSRIISSFAETPPNPSPSAHLHTPNDETEVIDLLPDGAFHAYHLPQDNVAVLVITDAISADSHSLFEMLKKIRDRSASRLIIYLSSSAVSMKESEKIALKEQLGTFIGDAFLSEVPGYRAVDTA